MQLKERFNKFLNKAKSILKPGKTIVTPSYQDPCMLQLEIQTVNHLLASDTLQNVLQMKIQLNFMQNQQNVMYSSFSKDQRLLVMVNISYISPRVTRNSKKSDKDSSFHSLCDSDQLTDKRCTVYLSQANFQVFGSYVYNIWKFSQIEETCKAEQEQNLDWEDQEHPKDCEDFCEAFSVKYASQLEPEQQRESSEKLIIADIDNELLGSDTTLMQLQEKSSEEKQRNFYEVSIDLDSHLELCCSCRKNLHWDEFIAQEFSTPSQKLSNVQKTISEFQDIVEDQTDLPVASSFQEEERTDDNDPKKDKESSMGTSSFVEKNTDDLNSAVVNHEEQDQEIEGSEQSEALLDSFNMTRDIIVEGEQETEDLEKIDREKSIVEQEGREEEEDFSYESGFSSDLAPDGKICCIGNSKVKMNPARRETDETGISASYQKTTYPHPGCSYLHRICISCKFTIFKEDPDRFCPECIFKNPAVSLVDHDRKFYDFAVVESKVDVRKVLDSALQNFEDFLTEYTEEKNFRLV